MLTPGFQQADIRKHQLSSGCLKIITTLILWHNLVPRDLSSLSILQHLLFCYISYNIWGKEETRYNFIAGWVKTPMKAQRLTYSVLSKVQWSVGMLDELFQWSPRRYSLNQRHNTWWGLFGFGREYAPHLDVWLKTIYQETQKANTFERNPEQEGSLASLWCSIIKLSLGPPFSGHVNTKMLEWNLWENLTFVSPQQESKRLGISHAFFSR